MGEETRILIVEDTPSDADLCEHEIRRVVPSAVFHVVETEEEYVKALREFGPVLVLSDYLLPRFTGLEALKLAQEFDPDLPFIIVTGSLNEETAVACMKAGAWDYVIKEHMKRLGPAVQGALEQAKMRREKKRAERNLEESEALFRHVFEDHSAVKLIIDPEDGRIVDANRAAVGFYGWPKDVLKGMRIYDINTLPEEELKKEMANVLAGRKVHFEFQHRTSDGSVRDVEVFSSRIEVKGRYLLHSIVHDITERKKIEEERLRLAAAVEQAGEIIFVTDREGTILYVNAAVENVTGYRRDEVLGQNPRLFKSGYQSKEFYRNLWDTILSGCTWRGRFVNRRKDGSLYTEDATIYPIRSEEGKIKYFVAAKRDVTELVSLQEEREALQAHFVQAQKMESIGRLAGGIAHDFNNMLGVILGHVEVALREVEEGSSTWCHLQEIMKAAEKSAELTRQLLTFARRQPVSFKVIDLNEVLKETVSMLRRAIPENITLAWETEDTLWPVKADPTQISRLVMNLVTNARDAIKEKGHIHLKTMNISVDEGFCREHPLFLAGDYVVIKVSDDGAGMDEKMLSHIFEPFFTTKPLGKGTGMGLATVYGIVKQHGGFIDVKSAPGVGTDFFIYLPRSIDEKEKAVEQKRITATPKGTGELILFVEDEVDLLQIGRLLIERMGYRVLATTSPQEALALAKERGREIKLLITDLIMPEMSGVELLHLIREQVEDMPCILSSGYGTLPAFTETGLEFLEKPYTVEALAAKIAKMLKRE